jgi:hypothetical protein
LIAAVIGLSLSLELKRRSDRDVTKVLAFVDRHDPPFIANVHRPPPKDLIAGKPGHVSVCRHPSVSHSTRSSARRSGAPVNRPVGNDRNRAMSR